MTRLTALLIAGDPEVHGTAYGPINGKFGVWIGRWEETRSGSPRMRTLLTSEPVYDTPDAARTEADRVLAEVRALPLSAA